MQVPDAARSVAAPLDKQRHRGQALLERSTVDTGYGHSSVPRSSTLKATNAQTANVSPADASGVPSHVRCSIHLTKVLPARDQRKMELSVIV